MVGVRTMPLLSDILRMRPTQKEPSVCHQTLTCLLSSSASSPCRAHPQSCQSQSPTHEVARRACRTIWKPYFPFSNHSHWNFREKACDGWRVGVGNSSLQTSRSMGSPSLSAGYDTIEIQSSQGRCSHRLHPCLLVLSRPGRHRFQGLLFLLFIVILFYHGAVGMYKYVFMFVCVQTHVCSRGHMCV